MKTTIIYTVTGGKDDAKVYKAFKDKRQAVEYARAEMLIAACSENGSNRFFYVQETMLQE